MGRGCSQNEGSRSAFRILRGKPTGRRPLGRHRRRWEENIRMDFTEISINTRNWVDSAQDKESPCECGIERPGAISYGVISGAEDTVAYGMPASS